MLALRTLPTSTSGALRMAWAWAMVAALALALLPTLSRWLVWSQVDPATVALMMDVCSADGSRGADSGSDESGGKSHHLDHCPLCSLAQQAAWLPTATLQWLPVVMEAMLPHLFLRAPRPLFAWVCAQPRGPPTRG